MMTLAVTDRNRALRLTSTGLHVAIAILTLADHFTVAIAVAMAATHGHADARRADSDTDFFRTRRLIATEIPANATAATTKILDHRMLLSMNLSGKQFAGNVIRSGAMTRRGDHSRARYQTRWQPCAMIDRNSEAIRSPDHRRRFFFDCRCAASHWRRG
jgi:hypothetical protein